MTTTPPPNTEAVETAMRYARTNHRIHSVLCEDADRIWLHVPEECKSVGAALCYGTARILAAEVERLRARVAVLEVAGRVMAGLSLPITPPPAAPTPPAPPSSAC